METSAFLEGVRTDLQTLTAGNENEAAVADRLVRVLESSLQLRLMDAMGQAALELTGQLASGHVEVRLAGRDVQLVLVDLPDPASGSFAGAEDGDAARLTLRLPESLKGRLERAADEEGLSTNAWLVRAISRALDPSTRSRRRGSRITGFAQS